MDQPPDDADDSAHELFLKLHRYRQTKAAVISLYRARLWMRNVVTAYMLAKMPL